RDHHRRRLRGRRPDPPVALHGLPGRGNRPGGLVRRHLRRPPRVRLHQGRAHRRPAAAQRRPHRGRRRRRRRRRVRPRPGHPVSRPPAPAAAPAPKRIAFLVFPRLTFLDLIGAYDALRRVATMEIDPAVTHRIIGTEPEITDESGLVVKPDAVYENLAAFDLLYVPGGLGARTLL